MSVSMPNNAPPRKQLSAQLDRFDEQLAQIDRVLDALADGLNAAVQEATREGTRLAVREAMLELLTNRDLRAALHAASQPTVNEQPSFWQRIKARATKAWAQAKQTVVAATSAVARKKAGISSALARPVRAARQLPRTRWAAKIIVGISAITAAARYAAENGGFAVAREYIAARMFRVQKWIRGVIVRAEPA